MYRFLKLPILYHNCDTMLVGGGGHTMNHQLLATSAALTYALLTVKKERRVQAPCPLIPQSSPVWCDACLQAASSPQLVSNMSVPARTLNDG